MGTLAAILQAAAAVVDAERRGKPQGVIYPLAVELAALCGWESDLNGAVDRILLAKQIARLTARLQRNLYAAGGPDVPDPAMGGREGTSAGPNARLPDAKGGQGIRMGDPI